MQDTITEGDRALRRVIKREWLSKFQAHKRWFDSLKTRSRNGKLSRSMKSNYNSALKQFMLFLNSAKDQELTDPITPDSFIEWAAETEPDNTLKILIKFENWLKGNELDDYYPRVLNRNERLCNDNTASFKAHGAIRGFLSHNQLYIPKSPRRDSIVPKTKKSDANYPIFKEENGEIVKDYTLLRYLLSELNFRDQVVALCLLSTSQDIGDLLQLNIGFVKNQRGRERLYWTGNRIKTGKPFRTFFSKEATQYLRRYIKQHRRGASKDEPIFIVKDGDPLEANHVSYNFRYTAEKMGIEWSDHAQNPFRPKRMRSIFSTACYQAKIDDGARHIFMGHAGTVSERYRELPTANLEVIYSNVEPYLTIYVDSNARDLEEARSKSEQAWNIALELKEEVTTLKQERDDLEKKRKANEWLWEQDQDIIADLGAELRELKGKFHEFEIYMNEEIYMKEAREKLIEDLEKEEKE